MVQKKEGVNSRKKHIYGMHLETGSSGGKESDVEEAFGLLGGSRKGEGPATHGTEKGEGVYPGRGNFRRGNRKPPG